MIDPEPRAHHPRRDQLHQPERALEVDLHHLVELRFVEIEHRPLRDVRRGVVHQDVDAAKSLRRDVDQILDLIQSSHVARDRQSIRPQFLRHRIERLLLPPDHDHLRALANERLRDRLPNPAARPGHNRNFIFQYHFPSIPPER